MDAVHHTQQCVFTELEVDVVKHVSLFPCNAFSDMRAVSGKTLQGKVLGTTPGLIAICPIRAKSAIT